MMSAATALPPPIDSAPGMAKGTLVFICYRRSDGHWHADWIDQALNEWTPAGAPTVHTYFDRTAPAVPDWKKHHFPSLQSADSLIVICTPGAAIDLSTRDAPDWVYEEIRWWLANRAVPPIVVDATGEGSRWTPLPIKEKWPELNRLPLTRAEAEGGTPADRERFQRRWREQIARTLEQGKQVSTFENVERLEAANRRLRKANAAMIAALGLALFLAAVAYVAYDRASRESSKTQVLNRFLSGLFYRADPDRQVGDIVTATQLLDSGARELEHTKDPETRFAMLVAIGTSYTGLGEHQKAITLLTEASELAKALDLNDDARFRLALGLGEALLYQNRFAEARPLLAEAMKLAPSQARERSRALVALGDLESWADDGDPARAEQLYEKALTLDKTGTHPLDVARDANRLGYLAWTRNDVDEAERRYAMALEYAEGGADLLLAKYENDRAATLYALGKIADARKAFEKARATLAKTYGETNGEVAVMDNNIARARIEEGDLDGVEARLIDAIEHQQSGYGSDFSDLALAYNNLGLVQLARGDALSAQGALNNALRIARKNDMPIAVQTLVHLSEVSMLRGDYDVAATHLEEAGRVATTHGLSGDWRYAIYESARGELELHKCDLKSAAASLSEAQAAFKARWSRKNLFLAAGDRRLGLLANARARGCASDPSTTATRTGNP